MILSVFVINLCSISIDKIKAFFEVKYPKDIMPFTSPILYDKEIIRMISEFISRDNNQIEFTFRECLFVFARKPFISIFNEIKIHFYDYVFYDEKKMILIALDDNEAIEIKRVCLEFMSKQINFNKAQILETKKKYGVSGVILSTEELPEQQVGLKITMRIERFNYSPTIVHLTIQILETLLK